jgi:hypothetical protein
VGEPPSLARTTVYFIPLCSGLGEGILVVSEAQDAPAATSEEWLASLDLAKQKDAPACRWLAWEEAQAVLQKLGAADGAQRALDSASH